MTINCIIVDDEEHALEVIKHHMKQVPYLNLIAATTNPLQALQLINTHQIDLIFLDIQMPELSGLDVVRAVNGKSKVILTTAYSEFAAEGFDLEVVDYLLKPVSLPRFMRSVQRAMKVLQPSTVSVQLEEPLDYDYIFVKTEQKGKMLRINISDIEYVEGMKNYVAIHHAGQRTLALLNMKDLEERLPKKLFMRVHKSFIIALNKIIAIEGNRILLRNIKADIVLGETYRNAFHEMMRKKLMQ
ncbi:LytR/AlgR family response regulator transcription factor [Pontibacter silvestris]|uniref:LytR/AlgR family response regulator transcription factor n=1 Tax=Pontibacter silvestris TaxID=2305183 RepID=A0ABW4WYC8_9BACT|nr:LytTR family DNA-binding domain-containing protein [Pontibacter silvestris]MCC9135180.1 LytTR family DNA-binding domain-containing protein [Pontibacter silvestris]